MKLKAFQKQDLARAALHNGLILSWDTGLGKTWAMFLYMLLKVGYTRQPDPEHPHDRKADRIVPNGPILIVAPGDLHAQIIAEAWSVFHIRPILLDSQEEFHRRTRQPGSVMTQLTADGRPVIAPEFYLTSYTQLTTNGVTRLPNPDDWTDPVALLQNLSLPVGTHQSTVTDQLWRNHPEFVDVCEFFSWRQARWADDYPRLETDPDGTIADMEAGYLREKLQLDALCARDPDLAARELVKLNASRAILKQLLTTRPYPHFANLAPSQQNFVLCEYLKEMMVAYADNIGAEVEYGYYAASTTTAAGWRKIPVTKAGVEADPNAEIPLQTNSIKCLYTPSLSDLCYNAFDGVVIDEGVRMKGEDTYVGLGVRQLDPKYRLLLTATPVKNRLVDIFRLAWWAAGGKSAAHARFPYRDDSNERAKFAKTFMVSESNLTKQDQAEADGKSVSPGRYQKLTAEVCNVHLLWKLLGPLVLRRRKDECGEDIVPKIRRVIRCEMGTLQQDVYSYHLQAEYLDKNDDDAIGAKLQALRMAAADPSSEHLKSQPGRCTKPCQCSLKPVPPEIQAQRLAKELDSAKLIPAGLKPKELRAKQRIIEDLESRIAKPVQVFDKVDANPDCGVCHGTGEVDLPARSSSSYIPKHATALTLIEEILARQEQVVVFSAFNDPLDRLSGWLDQANVHHIKLDGRTSQKKRGELAATFKRGRYASPGLDSRSAQASVPVMLAGVECMAEGHSFHLANNVILIAYSWAYDKFIQALNRVHRMTSPFPVNIYVIICTGTIDRKLESLVQDKGDAAELVLDGRLIGERTEEVNLAELLQIAQQEFNSQNNTIDEAMLQAQWPDLSQRLTTAAASWTAGAKVIEVKLPGRTATPKAKVTTNRHTPTTNYPPIIRRLIQPATSTITPMPKREIYHNSPLAAVLPPGTIITVPGGTEAARHPNAGNAMAAMRERAAKLRAAMKPSVDVWGQL